MSKTEIKTLKPVQQSVSLYQNSEEYKETQEYRRKLFFKCIEKWNTTNFKKAKLTLVSESVRANCFRFVFMMDSHSTTASLEEDKKIFKTYLQDYYTSTGNTLFNNQSLVFQDTEISNPFSILSVNPAKIIIDLRFIYPFDFRVEILKLIVNIIISCLLISFVYILFYEQTTLF